MLLVQILVACEADPIPLPGPLDLCETCDRSCTEEALLLDERSHVPGGVDYDEVPPTSGDHDPCWAPWGIHVAEVPDERWVHNLEHGGVVLLYHCPEGCPDEVGELGELVKERGDFGLLTPYAALATRFGAVAWGHRFVTDCFDLEAFELFWDAHVDQAPESLTVEPGASCPAI